MLGEGWVGGGGELLKKFISSFMSCVLNMNCTQSVGGVGESSNNEKYF